MKRLDKLTLKEMMNNFHLYFGLPDGLVQLPFPDKLKIGRKRLPIPQTLDEFTENLCYGQRIFLMRKEDNDFGIIVRVLDGYYYTLKTGEKWDEDNALLFGKYVINLPVKDIYPTAMHLISLISEMADKEYKLLHREPSKMELAAGIEKLNVFSELTNLDFLSDAMKCTVPEVLLTPYNECLVRFVIAKETADFNERYFKLMKEQSEPKSKYHA